MKTMKTNCLLWAIKQKKDHGGYIVPQWTKWNKWKWLRWPHFFWLPPGDYPFQSYAPKGKKIKRILPPPLFEGRVVYGDEKEKL